MDVDNNTTNETVPTTDQNEKKELPPLEAGWEDLTNDRGILKKILKEGTGQNPPNGAKISCHYVGTLTSDGSKFDSSRDRDEPFTFDLGQGNVIKGWDVGIASMKTGETCILRCAPEYAYGDRATGSIPPNSSLDFEVELLDWDNWQTLSGDNNKGIKKQVIEEGEGDQQVESGATVTISYVAKYTVEKLNDEKNWKQFAEEAKVQFVVDEDPKFVQGFHSAIQDMKKGGKAIFAIDSSKGYGQKGNEQYGVPPNATLIYEITVLDFTNLKKTWEMNTEEHFTEAEKMKAEGNQAFKENNYTKAIKKYNRAVEILEDNNGFNEEQKKNSITTLCAVCNNLALIYCKQNDYSQALTQANKVLGMNEDDVKALTRHGQSNLMLGNWEDAKTVLKRALQLKPDSYIENLLKECNNKIKQYNDKQKSLYGNMFKPKPSKKQSSTNNESENTETNTNKNE